MRAHTLAVALLALTAAAAGQRRRDRGDSNSGGAGGVKGFIRVSGNKFVDDGCGDFVPVGWNSELGCWGRRSSGFARLWICAPFFFASPPFGRAI